MENQTIAAIMGTLGGLTLAVYGAGLFNGHLGFNLPAEIGALTLLTGSFALYRLQRDVNGNYPNGMHYAFLLRLLQVECLSLFTIGFINGCIHAHDGVTSTAQWITDGSALAGGFILGLLLRNFHKSWEENMTNPIPSTYFGGIRLPKNDTIRPTLSDNNGSSTDQSFFTTPAGDI